MSDDVKRYAVSPDDTIVFDPRRTDYFAQEQEHPENQPEVTPECPEGQRWDEATGQCVPTEAQMPTENIAAEQEEQECDEGTHWDAEAGHCVPDVAEQMECPEGMHWDAEQNTCVPNEPPTETPAMETKMLGEPFADYSSFDDCVSTNQDKDDPEAYCADIQRKTEESVLEAKVKAWVKEAMGTTPLDEKHLQEQKELDAKHRREKLDTRLAEIDKKLKEMGFKDASMEAKYAEQNARMKQSLTSLSSTVDEVGKMVRMVTDTVTSLHETQTTHPDYQSMIDEVKAHITRLDTHIRDVQSAISTPPVVKETLELSDRLGKLEDDLTSLRTHVKPTFKGQVAPEEPDRRFEDRENPYASR